jgi:hypothetical protein
MVRVGARSERRRAWSLLPLLCLFAGCGGRYLADGSGGTAGDAGSLQGGGSGAATGGSAGQGGSAGTGSGAFGGSGGSAGIAGSGGGAGFGGTAGVGGSSAGAAGTGMAGACALPLDSGPCEAAIPAYGYNAASGHCERFIYGGCQGNANRFATLEACEQSCGGNVGGCPEHMPQGQTCATTGDVCTYTLYDECLCQVVGFGDCGKIDPNCTYVDTASCANPPCVAKVVIATQYSCVCGGTWSCSVDYGGGLK